MDIQQQLADVGKIVEEKIVTTDHASQQINSLFNNLIKVYAPDPEIEQAKARISKWLADLKEDGEVRKKKMDRLLSEIDGYVEYAESELREAKMRREQGLRPLNKPVRRLQLTSENTVPDYTQLETLINQLEIIWRLQVFAKNASKFIRVSKLRFRFLKFILQISKVIITILAIVASYYVGKLCELAFQVNPFAVAFVSAIICLYTSDNWLGKMKDYAFWKYATSAYEHSLSLYNSFVRLKSNFGYFADKYLK